MPRLESHFTSLNDAARSLSGQIASALRTGIEQKNQAILAVSGGRTPLTVFRYLRDEEVDWSKVVITLSDERWLPADHPDSNEKLARESLMQGPVAEATFLPLYGGEADPFEGQPACEQRLRDLGSNLDAIYLGMGEDGHFASLFPHDEGIHQTDSLCVAIHKPDREPRVARLSLTTSAIQQANHVFLLLSGEEKIGVYRQALEAGSADELPLRLLFTDDTTHVNVLISDN